MLSASCVRPSSPSAALWRFSGLQNRNYAALGVVLAVLGVVGVMGGCSASDDRTGSSGESLSGEITVLAAASLTDTFTSLGQQFMAEHPGTTVAFSFGSSSTLASQITNGAPADVFAAANPATMDTVDQAGQAVGRTDFATNVLQIAVPAGNPGGVTGLGDFADADQNIALCAKEVPCGSAAATVFAAAGITPKPDTYETDVKAALTKVTLGEVDAALVYTTDVKAAGSKVGGIAFPDAQQAVNVYPIATLKDSRNAAVATAFMAHVLSPAGRQVLNDAGFGTP